LSEGVAQGVFRIDDLDLTSMVIHCCVKGVEVPYIRGRIGGNLNIDTVKQYVSDLVLGGLKRKD